MKKILFFFCLMAAGALSALDIRIAHVLRQLDFLPPWCPPLSFVCDDDNAVVDGFQVKREKDEEGRTTSVILVREGGAIEGRIHACWEKGVSIDRLVRVDSEEVTHAFSYDEHDCAVRHVLMGNLSGHPGSAEEYETLFSFDEQHRPIEICEENGRIQQLKYPDRKDPWSVAVTTGPGVRIRTAIAEDGVGCQEIEDDGATTDIHDLSSVTWRVWRKASIENLEGELRQTVVVGAYDPGAGCEVVLRKVCRLLSEEGEVLKTEVRDANDLLVSRVEAGKSCDGFEPTSPEDIEDVFGRLLIDLQSAKAANPSVVSGGGVLSVRNTARGQRAEVTYADGSREERRYRRDGVLVEIVSRDGKRAERVCDCCGRLMSLSKCAVGGVSPSTLTYEYRGSGLCGWSSDAQGRCVLTRDLFGRITEIEQKDSWDAKHCSIRYDVLDRVIEVSATGLHPWKVERSFSIDGDEVTTRIVRDGQTTVVRETRRPDGTAEGREVTLPTGKGQRWFYDTQGRLVRCEAITAGRASGVENEVIVERAYEMDENGTAARLVTRFPGQAVVEEEQGASGEVVKRIWKTSDGTTVLEEEVVATDAQGSRCVLRRAGGETRRVEWVVGHTGRVQRVGGVEFEYDPSGRCSAKRSPTGDEVRYEWNLQGQLVRQYTIDGSVDYRFSYDTKGRICRALDAVAHKQVDRSFDEKGRLAADGELGAQVQVQYGDTGSLACLRLPSGEVLRYEGARVWMPGSWMVDSESTNRYAASGFLPCSSVAELECSDALGCWTESFSYDIFNQLQREEGEFCAAFSFDPFGFSEAARGCRFDTNGNMVEHEGATFEYDALGRLKAVRNGDEEERYRYDGFGRIQEIIKKDGSSLCLCWFGWEEIGALRGQRMVQLKVPHPTTWQAVAMVINNTPFRVTCDARGSIIGLYDLESKDLVEVYRYSAFGAIHVYGSTLDDRRNEAISPWLYCGKRILSGVYDFGTRRYCPTTMRWLEKDPLGLVDTIDDRLYVRNNPVSYTDPSGLFPLGIDWSEIGQCIANAAQWISSGVYKTITFAKQRLDWVLELRSAYEETIFQLLGRTWLRCSGYNLDATSSYVCGSGREPSNVRITLINGILNGAPEAKKSAALLSATHGHVNVHCVYSATEGFSGDLLRGAMAKAGVASRQARLLADLWRELIGQMGGVEGEGTILHYAHSLGATDTLNALQLMSPEERRHIRCSTFGSPTLLDDGICAQVDNYVSVQDGIPVLDFHRYSDGIKGVRANVHFVPSRSTLPLVDHYFDGETYCGVLELLGQKFQEEFLVSR